MSGDRRREKLARALGEFWYSGAGPTHSDIHHVTDMFDLEVDPGSKRPKVNQSVMLVSEDQLYSLVDEYLQLLNEHGDLDDSANQRSVRGLDGAIKAYGWSLYEGRLEGGTGLGVDLAQLPDVPSAREHVLRIQRSIRDSDDAQLIGSAKELLESVSKVVIVTRGEEPPPKFPAQLSKALTLLRLHPKSPPEDSDIDVEQVRIILSCLQQIALASNKLRNDYGTGHGRPGGTDTVHRRYARLAAGAAVVVATLMLDTLDDPGL